MANRTVPFRTLLVSTWAVISGFGGTYTESVDLLGILLAGEETGLVTFGVTVSSVLAGAVLLVAGVVMLVSMSTSLRYVGAGAFLAVAAPLVPLALAGGTNAAVVVALNVASALVLLACNTSSLRAGTSTESASRRLSTSASRLGVGHERNTPGRR